MSGVACWEIGVGASWPLRTFALTTPSNPIYQFRPPDTHASGPDSLSAVVWATAGDGKGVQYRALASSISHGRARHLPEGLVTIDNRYRRKVGYVLGFQSDSK